MNREIKFRAWDGTKMFCPVGLNENGTVHSNLWTTDNWAVMQFTGLKDKNGKEIYEGDIIRATTRSKVGSFKGGVQKWGWGEFSDSTLVVYSEPSTTLVKHLNGTYCSHLITIFGTARDCDGFIEIIGNIYENPDLLQ